MNSENPVFVPIRKKKWALSEDETWSLLGSREISFGFLGTHGVAKENNMPYVVPMTFAADRTAGILYFHATMDDDSRKVRAIKENPNVCFAVTSPAPQTTMVSGPTGEPCKFSMTFSSVMVFGEMSEVSSFDDKKRILNLLAKQKTMPASSLEVEEMIIHVTRVYELKIKHISGARKA